MSPSHLRLFCLTHASHDHHREKVPRLERGNTSGIHQPSLVSNIMYTIVRTALRRQPASITSSCPSPSQSCRTISTRILPAPHCSRIILTSSRRLQHSLPHHSPVRSDPFRKHLDSVPSPAEAVGEPGVDTSRGKLWESAEEAVKDIRSGSLILSAGSLTWLTVTLQGQ